MLKVEQRALDAYRQQFGRAPQMVARAPGRVNLIGEHTDYTGGFVLPCAIDRRVAVALGYHHPHARQTAEAAPPSAAEGEEAGLAYAVDLDDLRALPRTGQREGCWADYLRGVAWALTRAGLSLPAADAAVVGEVPQGAGLSSSDALEAATALALTALAQHHLPQRDLARLCQHAEKEFVGVHSGIMDHYAALFCTEGHALFIDCSSLEAEAVPLALEDHPVDLFGTDYPTPDGTCVRDYIHVLDLAQAHIQALTPIEPGLRVYNLGNGQGYSVRQVIESARRLTGRALPIREQPRRPGDQVATVASAERIRAELGWQAQHPDLESIVESAWRWKLLHPQGYADNPRR